MTHKINSVHLPNALLALNCAYGTKHRQTDNSIQFILNRCKKEEPPPLPMSKCFSFSFRLLFEIHRKKALNLFLRTDVTRARRPEKGNPFFFVAFNDSLASIAYSTSVKKSPFFKMFNFPFI